jgi:hypothetical protein
MCANCFSTFDVLATQVLTAGAALHRPVRSQLAAAGWVRPIDMLGEEAHTVAFLQALDLDPVEILGADNVTAAATWQPQAFTRRRLTLRQNRRVQPATLAPGS